MSAKDARGNRQPVRNTKAQTARNTKAQTAQNTRAQAVRGTRARPVRNAKGQIRNGPDAQPVKNPLDDYDEDMKKEILAQLKRQERRRRLICLICLAAGVLSLGYFAGYYYLTDKSASATGELAELKHRAPVAEPVVHKTGKQEAPDILDEYKNLYIKNKSLIGWVKVDDTIIDYPVMQAPDEEYYLTHNFQQQYDKNGSIFMDPACDVLKPSTNLILYGHNMKSGKMFGGLDRYSQKSYWQKHQEIQFDTLYEKGTYQVMYAFHARIYGADEITFKYYQFIDAISAEEFDSNMKAMEEMSLYDTGVEASFGDRLLTLSTCDNQEEEGRFVVVAKKVG